MSESETTGSQNLISSQKTGHSVAGGNLRLAANQTCWPAQQALERKLTDTQWSIMHAVLHGVGRDQLMAQHKANHFQIACAPSANEADRALAVTSAMFHELGLRIHLCGSVGVA